MDARQLVDTMKKILLATVAVLAFASPSFAAETGKAAEPAKTVGQAPPSSTSSFYLAQDTGTMKCQVVSAQPAAGGSTKVIGTVHPTQASAQTALTAEKTCK
jgi:ABC-type sugar transport system substrate-binding protein